MMNHSNDEIRLTGTSYAVLGLIEWLGESTPYDLKRLLEESVENFWPLPHTSFYVEPARLAKAGYLSERQEPGGRRRKLYSLTDRGRDALGDWVADTSASDPQYRDEGMLKIFFGADPQPILEERAEWHRAKLAELEGYLRSVDEAGGPEGVRRSLVAGTAYHRALLDQVARFLAGQAPR